MPLALQLSTSSMEGGPGGDGLLTSSDPAHVREWLQQRHHKKQLALLDNFLMELRLGRLSRSESSSLHAIDRRLVTHRTVGLLRQLIGSTKWKSPAHLMYLLRGLGREMHAVGGFREPAIGNVVRRIMAAVREEAARETQEDSLSKGAAERTGTGAGTGTGTPRQSEQGGRLSLQTMLWALPQHVRRSRSTVSNLRDRQESFASDAELETEYPAMYYANRPDMKQAVMEAIQEIMTDLEDMHKMINEQATDQIHAGEIILTCGRSKTIELFLKATAAKKRQFQVVVCEGAPHYDGHAMAKSLAEAGIDTIVINDSATFAMMARVNKVLLPAHAVLANGGLVASSGCNMVALAAHHNSVPVVCVTGMFKLCPMYPHEGQDTLNDLVSPSSVKDYAGMSDKLLSDVEFVNPVHDYIKPEHINLYVTNVGSFKPSYIYRLLAEYYHADDWESFD
jgi:translation initiation factor eIF-2B subunit beta